MARNYPSNGDKIRTSLGAIGPVDGDNYTIAVLCKLDSSRNGAWRNLASHLTAGGGTGVGFQLELDSGNNARWGVNGGSGTGSSFTVTSSDGWVLIVAQIAGVSGGVYYHKYVYSSNTWTHEGPKTSTGNHVSSAGLVEIGGDYGGSTDYFRGDIAVVGMWRSLLTTAQLENLPYTLQAWITGGSQAIWVLDQDTTGQLVEDITGGGANQTSITGTAVSSNSVPIFNYTDGVWLPTVKAAGGLNAYSLNVDPGTYSVSGVVAKPLVGRVVPASPGGYTVTGAAAKTVVGRAVLAAPGSYAVTGAAAKLVIGRVLAASPGSYVITGDAADLIFSALNNYVLNAAAGNYAVTGVAANVLVSRVLKANPGSYVVTGLATKLAKGYVVVALPGTYTVTGVAAKPVVGRVLLAVPGEYDVTGVTAILVPSGSGSTPTSGGHVAAWYLLGPGWY